MGNGNPRTPGVFDITVCDQVCDDWGRSKVSSIQPYVIEFVMTGDRSDVYTIQRVGLFTPDHHLTPPITADHHRTPPTSRKLWICNKF